MLNNMSPALVLHCNLCQRNHPNGECATEPTPDEQVNYMNTQRQNFHSNSYGLGYRDHPHSGQYRGNQGALRHSYNPLIQETQSNLEDMFQQFMQTHSNFVDRTEAKFKQYDAHLKNNEASIRNIEIQLGQISKQLSERPQGSLPSNTVTNPREQVNAITLRSGKELVEPEKPIKEEPSVKTKEQTPKGGSMRSL